MFARLLIFHQSWLSFAYYGVDEYGEIMEREEKISRPCADKNTGEGVWRKVARVVDHCYFLPGFVFAFVLTCFSRNKSV